MGLKRDIRALQKMLDKKIEKRTKLNGKQTDLGNKIKELTEELAACKKEKDRKDREKGKTTKKLNAVPVFSGN